MKLTSRRNLTAQVQAKELALRVILCGQGVDDGGILNKAVTHAVSETHDTEPYDIRLVRNAELLIADLHTFIVACQHALQCFAYLSRENKQDPTHC